MISIIKLTSISLSNLDQLLFNRLIYPVVSLPVWFFKQQIINIVEDFEQYWIGREERVRGARAGGTGTYSLQCPKCTWPPGGTSEFVGPHGGPLAGSSSWQHGSTIVPPLLLTSSNLSGQYIGDQRHAGRTDITRRTHTRTICICLKPMFNELVTMNSLIIEQDHNCSSFVQRALVVD